MKTTMEVVVAITTTENAIVELQLDRNRIIFSCCCNVQGDFMSKQQVDFVSTDGKLQKRISSDQQIEALQKMRDIQINKEDRLEIQALIAKRIVELTREIRKG